uniref:NADH-ubiquinone oxidoreductase chain 6 n=1 Tax=Ophiopholis japonica TaxID=861513 RepID=A0A6C0FJP0_9ECHI|nr:NADH dehydrogenase subunit 6 [Ophiopholis japonica]QHT54230.1 NADH dehydrogenase subunit 6 [Ophiopholis japonica]
MLFLAVLFLEGGALFLIFSSSPFFSVFGVLAHCLGHAVLFGVIGAPFLALLLVVVYAGGMLVVFLFSTILSAEQHPSVDWPFFILFWASISVLSFPLAFSGWSPVVGESYQALIMVESFSFLYLGVGLVSLFIGFILLAALLAVLELGFEHGLKSLRKL